MTVMIGKKSIKALTEILDIEGVKVISHRLHAGIGLLLQTESTSSCSICPRCGTKSHRLHQNHRYIVKDLPFGEKPVFLEINRRQFKCDICKKPFSEELNFVSWKRTYTKRLAKKIIQDVLENDIHSIASKGIVTTEEIERMLKDASNELYASKPLGLKRLGIDEIALIKGHGNYCTVFIDLDTSKLIAMSYGRTQEVVKKTLLEWGNEILGKIEEVSIDLWQGYRSLVKELMPHAQLVADRFHVMKQINKELDTQRKREKSQIEEVIKKAKLPQDKADGENYLQGITKSKYVLLKNEDDLNEIQRYKLIQVKLVSHNLNIMHELKEEIRQIFEKTNHWYDGLFKLGTWLLKAKKHYLVELQHNTSLVG